MRISPEVGVAAAILAGSGFLTACASDPKEITTQEIRVEADVRGDRLNGLVNDRVGAYVDQLGEACVHALLAATRLDYEEAQSYNGDPDFTKESGAAFISGDCTTSRPEDLDNLFQDFSSTIGVAVVSEVDEAMLADIRIDDTEYKVLTDGIYEDLLRMYQANDDYEVVALE